MFSRRLSAPSTPSLLTATFGLSLLVNIAAILYQIHIITPDKPSYSTSPQRIIRRAPTHVPPCACAP